MEPGVFQAQEISREFISTEICSQNDIKTWRFISCSFSSVSAMIMLFEELGKKNIEELELMGPDFPTGIPRNFRFDFVSLLKKPKQSLKRLRFYDVFDYFTEGLTEFLIGLPNLTSLDLERVTLTDHEFLNLSSRLPIYKLEDFKAPACDETGKALNIFFKRLSFGNVLHTLYLERCLTKLSMNGLIKLMCKMNELEDLNLAGHYKMSRTLWKKLFQEIGKPENCPKLSCLCLAGCDLGDNELEVLCLRLKNKPHFRFLNLADEYELDTSNDEVTSETLTCLMEFISVSPSLERISIFHTPYLFADDELEALSQIKELLNVVRGHISFCEFGHELVLLCDEFSRVLAQNQSLRTRYLCAMCSPFFVHRLGVSFRENFSVDLIRKLASFISDN
jgi:hypothetical protein